MNYRFSLKTFILILLLTSLLLPSGLLANKDKKLHKAIIEFGEDVAKGTELTDKYLLDYQEFEQLFRNKISNQNQLNNGFERYSERGKEKLQDLQDIAGELSQLISYDTITYKVDQIKMIAVSVKYKLNDVAREMHLEDDLRILCSFYIVNNRLKFGFEARTISDYHYFIEEMNIVYGTRKNDFYGSFKGLFFSSGADGFVPFKINGQWGLMNLRDGEKLDNLYDSIYAFQDGYSRVVLNSKHNLLNSSGSEVSSNWYKSIVYKEGKYYLTADDNTIWTLKEGKVIEMGSKDNLLELELIEEDITHSNNTNRRPTSPKKSDKDVYEKKSDLEVVRSNKYGETGLHHIVDINSNDTIRVLTGYDFITKYRGYFIGRRNEESIVLDQTGRSIFETNYLLRTENGHIILFDRINRLFGAFDPYNRVLVKPKYNYIKPIDINKFYVILTEKGDLGYLNQNGRELY